MFKLTIETDNAAFEDDCGAEVARILERLSHGLRGGKESGNVYDVNGNKVGSWSLELPKDEGERQADDDPRDEDRDRRDRR